jgi:hypothetical protein
MRQVVTITDSKASCLTLEDGRMHKNAFGLDRPVISRMLSEHYSTLRASGSMILSDRVRRIAP